MKVAKNYFSKVVIFLSMIALVSAAFTPLAEASQENQEVEELALALEAIDKSLIKDAKGNIVDIDLERYEEIWGSIPSEIVDLKEDIKVARESAQISDESQIQPMFIGSNECYFNRLREAFGPYFTTATFTSIFNLIQDGHYMKAAGDIAKLGVRGSVVGIAAELAAAEVYCLFNS